MPLWVICSFFFFFKNSLLPFIILSLHLIFCSFPISYLSGNFIFIFSYLGFNFWRLRLSLSQVWPFLECLYPFLKGFPDSSAGKESACNAGDPDSIPGSGRFPGDRIGYPLQYSWASFVAQLMKNLPSMWETWVWSLGWEDSLEKG